MPGVLQKNQAQGLSKKRTVLLLRSVVIISTGYLIIFAPDGATPWSVVYIAALLLSNIALALTPREWFHDPRISALLLLGDTAAVLIGLYLTVGCFSQDFLIIYFFTIFLTTATQGVEQIALGAAMVSGLYGYWLWISAGHTLGPGEWLRLPFFFIVAVFYAYMTEETKVERWRRQEAERERERLHFLLHLGDPTAPELVGRKWVAQVGSAVEAAFPRLTCRMTEEPPARMDDATGWFPMAAGPRTFGGLVVTARDDRPLRLDEAQFCNVVALVAAHVLAAAQTGASDERARVKREFLGMLSHELRTPLHAILGYAEMLDGFLHPGSDAQCRGALERLRCNAHHLQDLLGEMLWLAELQAGERATQVQPIDIADLFAEHGLTVAQQLAGRPIRFEMDVAHGVPRLCTDRRKLSQIVSCLLNNAAKFTEQGFVRLSAARGPNDTIEIAVADSGVGIAPEHFELIFEEFRQVDASLTRRVGGLGLGLALARELTTLLGGRIDVESRQDAGTVFRVHLPVGLAASAAAAAVHGAPTPSARGVSQATGRVHASLPTSELRTT